MMQSLTITTLLSLPVAWTGIVAGTAADDDCTDLTPAVGPAAALTRVHEAQGGTDGDAERAISAWLPAFRCLEPSPGLDEGWLHLGADLGRLLVRLDRLEEAHGVFSRVRELDPSGDWGGLAGRRIYALENLRPGMPAPAFAGVTLSGEPLTRDDLIGEVVVLDFWATWCAPCVAELPRLEELRRRLGDEGLRIVGVALDESREPVRRVVAEHDLAWPQLWDGEAFEGTIPRLFAVEGPATFFVLDRRGRIAAGPLGGDRLEAAVTAALNADDGSTR